MPKNRRIPNGTHGGVREIKPTTCYIFVKNIYKNTIFVKNILMEKIADGFKGEKAIVTPYNVRYLQAANPICKQLFVTHIGYYPTAKYHYRERPEGCNENILIFCENGKGWIKHKGAVHSLVSNQVFIIPAHDAHSYGANNEDPWSIYWFHFCGEHVPLFANIIGKIIQVDELDNGRNVERLQLFEEMYQNLEMGYSPENLEYVNYCLSYFMASLKYINQFREIKKVKVTDVVQKSILFMKDNLENKITLEDIAQHVSLSVSYFGAFFAKKTQYAPMIYYNQLKIQRACSYLQFSDVKIKEIAFRLGYYDPFHFSKAFHQEMEISPKEYRKRYASIQ